MCLFMFILVGCVANPPVTVQPPQVSTITPAPSETQIPVTHVPTHLDPFTPVPSKTPTPAPISVIIPTPEEGIQVRCADASSIPQGKWGDGQVVLGNRKMLKDNQYELGSFLLEMTTRQIKNLDEPPNYYYFVDSISPDRSKLIVGKQRFDDTDHTIILDHVITILSNDGIVLKQITPSISWQLWASKPIWLDNEHVIMDIAMDPDENARRKLITSMVLDPFTGREQILKPDFPYSYVWSDRFPRHERWVSGTAYNSSLTQVVYLGEKGSSYVLWDLRKRKLITAIIDETGMRQPRWSPDGTRFAMTGYFAKGFGLDSHQETAYGFYLVSQYGKATKLLDYWTFDDYFWSPSGRYLALYWMDPNSGQSTSSRNLVILNTQTLEAVDTCVQFSLPLDIPAPVWSPDETQILLNDAYLDNHQFWLTCRKTLPFQSPKICKRKVG
jgi:WD40 repeat protein